MHNKLISSGSGIIKDLAYVIGSFCCAFGSLSQLKNDDRVSVSRGCVLTFFGFIYFKKLTTLLNKLLLQTTKGLEFIHHFHLSLSDALDITNKVVSAIQAGLSCLFGVLVCQWSCSRNFLTTSHVFSESYAWFGASYFIYDIWSMFVVYNTKIYDKMQMKLIKWDQNVKGNFYSMIPSFGSGELSIFKPIFVNNEKIPSFVEYMKKTPLMIFHHMFIGSYGLIVISSLRGGLGDCIFSFMFMMEFSTPFVSFRAILSIIKLKNSKLYFINGLMMVISFLVCRIIMLPTLMYVYSTIVKLSFLDAVVGLPLGCQISILCLFLPQFYWFNLMVKGVLKMCKTPKVSIVNNNHSNKAE